MTDVPFRVYGPQPLNAGAGETLYTAPAGTQKMFIRDITLTNLNSSSVTVRMSVGSITDPSKRVVDQAITTGTPTFLRPLWLLDSGETLQGLQVVPSSTALTTTAGVLSSGNDASAYSTAAWIPAANTMYLLFQTNGVASGTTALNPSSITGNGSWTLVNQTTSTVATAVNQGVSVWWWFSTTAGSSAATTVNFASNQHSCTASIASITNVYAGTVAVSPWTSSATPIVQSAVSADATAPASTNLSKTVSLAALKTGLVVYYCSRVGDNQNVAPPTDYTEGEDRSLLDATGSVASISSETSRITTPPASSTPIGPATFGSSTTGARASVAFELVPGIAAGAPGWVNCMVSGIEVH